MLSVFPAAISWPLSICVYCIGYCVDMSRSTIQTRIFHSDPITSNHVEKISSENCFSGRTKALMHCASDMTFRLLYASPYAWVIVNCGF